MTKTGKQTIRDNFNKSAGTYDSHAVVQKEMAKDLVSHLKKIKRKFNKILEIGCGTGYLTGLLAETYPNARIVALDISPKMVDIARENLAGFKIIEYVTADGEHPPLDEQFDLIVSNATFQWFTGYCEAFKKYHRLLEPNGNLVFNMLVEGTLEELRFCLSKLNGTDFTSKTLVSLPSKLDILKALDKAGFADVELNNYLRRENYISTRHLILAIKRIGAGGFSCGGGSLRDGIGAEVFKLSSLYEKRFFDKSGVFASYHCLLGSGRKLE